MHATQDDYAPLGAAVVLDQRRLLTSTHVTQIGGQSREQLFVAFPFAGPQALARIPVTHVRAARAAVADVALLELATPVPDGVSAARLRCPAPDELEGLAWWAFGFPGGDWKGNDADGLIGRALGYGWVRLDTQSRFVVQPGFSGSGLWCPNYDAVIAVVGEADSDGNGQAISLHHADQFLPEEKIQLLARWTIQASDELARQAWNWTLDGDGEADRHWRPRARGVTSNTERGHRFRGRASALQEIIDWLDRSAPDRRVLVVTGSPGAGKSAVLGRVVVTADPTAGHPGDRAAGRDLRATVGSVACAVHAKGKTALEVAREIARAASAAIPDQPQDLPAALQTVLMRRPGARFNLLVDALDEASDTHQVRTIVREVIRPIATDCAGLGAQVVVGTRHFDGDGDLLCLFTPGAMVIDLDDPAYFALEDLAAYAHATLQLSGAERPGNPYQSDEVAGPVARRIAELADRNFLVANLVAGIHGLYDQQPIPVEQIRFTARVQDALAGFLQRIPAVDGASADELLTGLAYVDAPGVTLSLWQAAVHGLTGHEVTEHRLGGFARSSAANFLIEATTTATTARGGTGPVFRLFHQALNDTLIHQSADGDGETAVTRAFLAVGRQTGWNHAPAYLLRSLPDHAGRTHLIDTLLTDTDYALHADLRRLIPAASAATTSASRRAASLLRRTPAAIDATPAQRLALFSVAEAFDTPDITTYRDDPGVSPYRALWANVVPRMERTVMSGHVGRVTSVCAVRVDGRDLLASASDDATVRIWDPTSGVEIHQLTGHLTKVTSVCAVRMDGRDLLAVAGQNWMIWFWDPANSTELVAVVGDTGGVTSVCAVQVDGRDLLASASEDATVRIWDPTNGTELHQFTGHTERVNSVCAVQVDGRDLLASASDDATVRILDPATGVEIDQLTGHTEGVTSVCAVRVEERDLLVSAGNDRTVRIWNPATDSQLRPFAGHIQRVNSVCAVQVDGRDLLASASDDATVRIWDPTNGTELCQFTGHIEGVTSICAVRVEERDLLASAGKAKVRIWDPATGTRLCQFINHTGWVTSVCAVRLDGRDLLASASEDATIRVWDPATGTQLRQFADHASWVTSMCAVRLDGRDLLASASKDTTVRIWDPVTGTELARIPTYSVARALVSFGTVLIIGLDTGLLTVHFSLDPDPDR